MPAYSRRVVPIRFESRCQEKPLPSLAIAPAVPSPPVVPMQPALVSARILAAPVRAPGFGTHRQRKGPACLSNTVCRRHSCRTPGTISGPRLAQAKPGNDHARRTRDRLRYIPRRPLSPPCVTSRRLAQSKSKGSRPRLIKRVLHQPRPNPAHKPGGFVQSAFHQSRGVSFPRRLFCHPRHLAGRLQYSFPLPIGAHPAI